MNRIFRQSNYLLRLCILITLVALTCFTVVACSTSNNASGGVPEIVVATEDDYPPYDFLKDGKHVGYNQDLLELVTKDAPFKVKQEILPIKELTVSMHPYYEYELTISCSPLLL